MLLDYYYKYQVYYTLKKTIEQQRGFSNCQFISIIFEIE